jgi:UDP-N-acetylmuramoylalanine--D-glutamate ligase
MTISADTKSVAIWGFGREGAAALDFLRAYHPRVAITVLNDEPLGDKALAALGEIPSFFGAEAGRELARGAFQVVIKSPGVSPYRPEVEEAKRRGTDFTSVTNLWFEKNPTAKTIAISGTKGKSTTSNLVFQMLSTAGKDTCLIGNGGVPALTQVAPRDFAVLELSSYQIADLRHAPTIAVLTNLHPEHAPWHRSVDRYFADKLRLAELRSETILVANHADPRLRAHFVERPNTVWFNAPTGFEVRDGALLRRGAPFETPSFRLKGQHNLSNLAAALTVAEIVGLDLAASERAAAGFGGLPHRMAEFVVGDVLCVDDSISTIPEATIAALRSYPDRDACLLLGGTDRGQNYGELYEFLRQSRVKFLALLPPNGARIAEELTALTHTCESLLAKDLDEAVEACFRRLNSGDLLLLSPAAPSFGQFSNFEERGRVFEELCRSKGVRLNVRA